MKEIHVITEFKQEEFEKKLERFVNNGWNIINSNLIVTDKIKFIKKPDFAEMIYPNKENLTNKIYYALLMKED